MRFTRPTFRLFSSRARPRHRRETVYRDHYTGDSPLSRLRWILVAIAAVLLIQSIFQIPFFQIRNVEVRGLTYIPPEEVQAFVQNELNRRRFVIFKNNNYFLFGTRRLQERLESRFYVRMTSIKKRFPHSLVLELEERLSAFVVQTPEKYYQLDARGMPLQDVEAPQTHQSVIADERSERPLITQDYLEALTAIRQAWEALVPQTRIAKFHLTDDQSVITIATDKQYRVIFDARKDLKKQVERLAVYVQDLSLEQPQEYIDLRFDERVYVK